MNGRALLAILLSGAALLALSSFWLVTGTVLPDRDEDWRWRQPLAGDPPPAQPTLSDLYQPLTFGPLAWEFTIDLPQGMFAYALAEEAPIDGVSFAILNSTGVSIAQDQWGPMTGLGAASYGTVELTESGPATFELAGEGRFMLLDLAPLIDLSDGIASIRVEGRVASVLPEMPPSAGGADSERLRLEWMGTNPVRFAVYDASFHVMGESSGESGGLDIRSGASGGVYYRVEGTSEVTMRLSVQARTFVGPWFPLFLIMISVLLIIASWRGLRSKQRKWDFVGPRGKDAA